MFQKTAKNVINATVLVGSLLGSAYASAACPDGTTLAPLASDIANGTKNTTICVDQLNYLSSNHFVYNIDTPVTGDGIPLSAGGTPLAFKHMWLMGSANALVITKKFGGTDPLDTTISDPAFPVGIPRFSIIGIIHGSALKWALSDEWWESQKDKNGNQLYPEGNPNKAWFDKIIALQKAGMDIRLEVCGVTLEGAGLTRDDVYSDSTTGFRILVNQGAFGRMSHLHAVDGYAIVSEGWEDNDKMHHDND